MDQTAVDWIVFAVFLAVLLIADIAVSKRHTGRIPIKTAAAQTVFCITLAVLFAVYVFIYRGTEQGLDYLSAYITEETMSMDNLFVFILIFSTFMIPEEYRHRILFFGVYGAIVLRALFIVIGSDLLNRFEIAIYIFGAILVIIAIKSAIGKEKDNGRLALWLNRHLHMSRDCAGGRFFTVENGKRIMTPMMACVIAIELTDVLFAVDSIPACLGITTDVFLVYSSNIFAVLGLRSLFFVLEGSTGSLRFMKYGLACILGFVGAKMLLSGTVHINSFASLGIIVGIIIITVVSSKICDRKERRD